MAKKKHSFKLVFCSKCKYYMYNHRYYDRGWCEHPINISISNISISRTPIEEYRTNISTPNELNCNNDCDLYEPKWFERLKNFFKG
jgi:hypothetical protein